MEQDVNFETAYNNDDVVACIKHLEKLEITKKNDTLWRSLHFTKVFNLQAPDESKESTKKAVLEFVNTLKNRENELSANDQSSLKSAFNLLEQSKKTVQTVEFDEQKLNALLEEGKFNDCFNLLKNTKQVKGSETLSKDVFFTQTLCLQAPENIDPKKEILRIIQKIKDTKNLQQTFQPEVK